MRILLKVFLPLQLIFLLLASPGTAAAGNDEYGLSEGDVTVLASPIQVKPNTKTVKVTIDLKKKPTKPAKIGFPDNDFLKPNGEKSGNGTISAHPGVVFTEKGRKDFTVTINGAPKDGEFTTLFVGIISPTSGKFFYPYLGQGIVRIASSDNKNEIKVVFSPATVSFSFDGGTREAKLGAHLSKDPGSNVTVELGRFAEVGSYSITPDKLVFNSSNFSKDQTVTIKLTATGEFQTIDDHEVTYSGSTTTNNVSGSFKVKVSSSKVQNATSSTTDTGAAGFGSPLGALISEESGFVYQAWRVTRSVINILLIIALFAISFSNITRINIDTYTIKKALPNLIVGIILANASLYIIRFMSDVTTVVTYFFVDISNVKNIPNYTFARFIGDTSELIGRNTLETIGWGVGILAPILVFLFAIITIIGLLWLAFLLYFRLVAIYLLTILSPLAFVSYGIPGFDKYFKQWWQQFTKWLFIVPAMSAVFWLMLVIGRAGDNQSIARLLIMYVLFYTALTLPSKMGGAVIDKASKAFMKYTGANAAMNASKEYAQLKGQQIGYRLPGVARYQAWRDLQKENAKKDIEQLKKRGRNKVLEGKTGRNYEKLKLLDKEVSMKEEEVLARKEVEAGNLRGGLGHRNESISERLIVAEYEKKLAEEIKNENDGQEKLEFLNSDNEETKKLLKNVFKATINQEVVSKEVGRAENQQKGNIATGYLQPLQAASNYSQLRSELKNLDINDPQYQEKKTMIEKAMNDIKTSFEALKKREGNEEYAAFKDLDDFMIAYDPDDDDKKDPRYDKYKKELGTQIRVWQGRQRQTSKMFNEGVAGQIETDVKEQTVAQLERELKAYFKKELKGDTGLHQLFMKGDTAALSAQGIEDKDIRAGRVIMEKYKQLMRSTNDIRNRDALNSFVNAHNEVLAGTGYEFNQQLLEDASSNTQQDRRAAAGHIAQESGIMSGQPHYANQNGKPLTPNPYQRKTKKQKVNIPPPPTPPERRAGFRGDPDYDQRKADYDRALNEWQQQYGDQAAQTQAENDDEENNENT